MAEVLAPRLELLRRRASLFGELCERVPETMRIEIRKARGQKGLLENLPDRRRRRPMFPAQALNAKAQVRAEAHLRARKQGIAWAEQLVVGQVADPVGNDRQRLLSNREKPRREGFAEFGFDVSCVLKDLSLLKVDMPKFQGGGRELRPKVGDGVNR